MRPIRITKNLTAGVASAVAASQTPAGAGNLTINGSLASGGVATFTTSRRVLFTWAGADAGRTATLVGTNSSGSVISENVSGANTGTTASVQDYLTVTRIGIDAATAGAVQVGTNTVGSTDWQELSREIAPENVSVSVKVTGTVNYTVEYTYDGIQAPPGINQVVPVPTVWPMPALLAQTTNKDASLTEPVAAIRCTINSGTGTIVFTLIQAGISGN